MTEFEQQFNDLMAGLAAELTRRNWRMATAESCTGGLIAKCCTDIAGSSNWFDSAYVVYSYEAKERMLGIPHGDLLKYTAVSEEIAGQMAVRAKQRSKVEVVVSVTGIAGPGGARPGKPVGLVHFGWCVEPHPLEYGVKIFQGDRQSVREQTVLHALEGIRTRLNT